MERRRENIIISKNAENIVEKIFYLDQYKAIKKYSYKDNCNKGIQREISILNHIKNAKINVPTIIDTDFNSYLIEEYIEGISLDEYLRNNDSTIVGNGIIDIINKLHMIDVTNLHVENPEFIGWKRYLLANIDKYKGLISEMKDLPLNSIMLAINHVSRIIVNMKYSDRYSVLIHNDLNDNNIRISEEGKVYFLDFERWIIGDPLKEVSKMIWWFRKYKNLGDYIYREMVEKKIIRDDLGVLRAYFLYDILFHLSMYEERKHDENWKNFYAEELNIIAEYKSFDMW